MLIGILSGRYQPYGRGPLALWPRLIGFASERYARFPSAWCPISKSPKSTSIGVAAQAHLLAIATSLMAGANSRYERASSALPARSYIHSAPECPSENPHPDAAAPRPPMRNSGSACDPSSKAGTPHGGRAASGWPRPLAHHEHCVTVLVSRCYTVTDSSSRYSHRAAVHRRCPFNFAY